MGNIGIKSINAQKQVQNKGNVKEWQKMVKIIEKKLAENR